MNTTPPPTTGGIPEPGKLTITTCRTCGLSSQLTRGFCPGCGGRDLVRDGVAATGTVVAATVVHRAAGEGPLGPPPFALVLVALDRPFANRLMAVAPRPLAIGTPVHVGPLGAAAAAPYLAIPEPDGDPAPSAS